MTDWQRRRKEESRKAYDALMKFYPLTLDDLDGEQWADIAGYEGLYQESTFGRTKSFCKGKVKILKPTLRGEYLSVSLHTGGKVKHFSIHRLVAETFIPNPDNKPQTNHRDGHKLNCHVSNLEWATGSENQRHAIDIGLRTTPRGEDNYQATLTNEQATWCRSVYKPYDSEFGAAALARKLGKHPNAIKRAIHGETYNKLGESFAKRRLPMVTESVRHEIRRLYKKGDKEFGAVALAKIFGLHRETVRRIVNEK